MRRLDLHDGVVVLNLSPSGCAVALPRNPVLLRSRKELTDLINELMEVREELLERPGAFQNEGTGDA